MKFIKIILVFLCFLIILFVLYGRNVLNAATLNNNQEKLSYSVGPGGGGALY